MLPRADKLSRAAELALAELHEDNEDIRARALERNLRAIRLLRHWAVAISLGRI